MSHKFKWSVMRSPRLCSLLHLLFLVMLHHPATMSVTKAWTRCEQVWLLLALDFSGFRNVDELSNTRPVATHVAMGLWKNRTSVAFENQAAIRLKIIFSHLLQFWCTLKAGWSLTVNMRSIETFTIQWISSCVDWHIPTHLEQSTTLSDLPNKTNNQILLLHLLAFNPTSN